MHVIERMGSNTHRPGSFTHREREPNWLPQNGLSSSYGSGSIIPIEWRISIGTLYSVMVELGDEIIQIDTGALHIGGQSEYISCEANEIIFQGTSATVLRVDLVLPAGSMSILWSGNALGVDDKYSIENERFSYWNHSPDRIRNVRTITVTAGGEDTLPMTLWHANRYYVIRFEEHYSAIVVPREIFYPLKLSLMRDFVGAFIPNVRSATASVRSSDPAERQSTSVRSTSSSSRSFSASVFSAHSPRGPPTSSRTPESQYSSNQ